MDNRHMNHPVNLGSAETQAMPAVHSRHVHVLKIASVECFKKTKAVEERVAVRPAACGLRARPTRASGEGAAQS